MYFISLRTNILNKICFKYIGSPVTFIAQDSGVPKIEGPGLLVAQVECPATFKIMAKGLWGHPQVTVDGK